MNERENTPMNKAKLNKPLLIAFIIGILYLVYSFFYWSGAISSSASSAEQLGAGLATVLVMPHLIMTALAVLFNALGLFLRKKGFALTGAILYTIAIILFPIYFMFVIIETILSYVGFATMPKQKN